METIVIKIIYLFIVFLICFGGGIAPITLTKYFGGKALSYSNCLGAGILLGAATIHLLSESEEMIESDFPLSHLFFIIGFFVSFILERVLFEHKHDHSVPNYNPHHKDKHGDIELLNDDDDVELDNIKDGDNSPITISTTPGIDSGTSSPIILSSSSSSSITDGNHSINTGDDGVTITLHSGNVVDGSKDTDDEEEENLVDNNHSHGNGNKKKKKKNKKNKEKKKEKKKGKGFPFMLFSVLALESIISGSALGVQEENISIFVTFLAIVTHIWAESFALTAAILKSKPLTSTIYKSVFIFSLMTPIGGVFGLISEHLLSKSQSTYISGILMALASGCFLYVSIFEVMVEEFQEESDTHGHGHNSHEEEEENHSSIEISDHHKQNRFPIPIKWRKTLLLVSGFTFMTVLAIYV